MWPLLGEASHATASPPPPFIGAPLMTNYNVRNAAGVLAEGQSEDQ